MAGNRLAFLPLGESPPSLGWGWVGQEIGKQTFHPKMKKKKDKKATSDFVWWSLQTLFMEL